MNLNGRINLLKLEKTGIMTINGKSGSKVCVVIPVEENDIYVTTDETTGKPKSAFLGINAWQNQSETGVDQYGNSHAIKQSFSQQYREGKTEEEMKNKPFLGNMRPVELKSNTKVSAPVADVTGYDEDLPF